MEGLDRHRWRTNARRLRALLPIALIALTAPRVSTVTMKAAGDGDGDGNGCDPARMTLRFRLVNEAGTHPVSLERAMIEAQTIWATAGVHLVWTTAALAPESPAPALAADAPADGTIARDASGNDDVGASVGGGHAYVIVRRDLVRVHHDVAELGRRHRTVMGRVLYGYVDGPLQLIEVSLSGTVSSINNVPHFNRPVSELPDRLRYQVVGRAIGRVIAHEIGHWLFGRGHTATGLMKPVIMPRELVALRAPTLPRSWLIPGAARRRAWASHCQETKCESARADEEGTEGKERPQLDASGGGTPCRAAERPRD
jgi:hypothetical protein